MGKILTGVFVSEIRAAYRKKKKEMFCINRPVSIQWLDTSLLVREVWGSITGPVKLDAVSRTARHLCVIASELSCSNTKWRR